MYAAEDALVELAQKAGSFMVTLVNLMEQGSIDTFSDFDSMNAVIEGLTKCVLTPHSISRSDKEPQRDESGSRTRQEDFFSKIADATSPKRLRQSGYRRV